jgi:hypothetical protein
MYISYIFIIAILTLVSSSSALASTNSTSNVGVPLSSQIRDLIENPFFGPDASCDLDAYQLHCIPGEVQDCNDIPGFNQNEDGTCHLDGECRDGYHSAEDDESGQCYPDTEPCYPGMVRNQTDANDKNCEDEDRPDTPDASCLTNPGQEKCNAQHPNVGSVNRCPDGVAVMTSVNFTSSKCVPENVEEQRIAEREREVFDKNRCHPDYELYVSESVDIWRTGGPIGSCKSIN